MTYDAFGYHRESWTVAWRDARAPLKTAIEGWCSERGVTLGDDLAALETRSVQRPGLFDRLFGRSTESWSLAVVGPGLVIWSVQAPRTEDPVTLAAPLVSVVVERGMGGRIGAAFAKAKEMRGLSFTAAFVGATEVSTAFLGFGREPDGDAFERRVREAAKAAGNPVHGLVDG